MSRAYRQRQRAESRERTRRRIVEAAIALHQAQGLAATTMRDVAARAGVGTVTVYRHFPDAAALVGACSGAYFGRHPFPDLDGWSCVPEPAARLRRGLREAYAYHRATEPMMARVLEEARNLPVMAPYHAYWARAADVLAAGWRVSGRRRALLKASLALALGFETWRLLVRTHGLTDDQAIALMMRLTGEGGPKGG
jgi:AcrR family transcriptional regulator